MMYDFLTVYISRIPQNVEITSVFPVERDNEIKNCKSLTVQKERFCAWKLLEKAVKEEFNLTLQAADIVKSKSGKWLSDKFYFSISHSHGLIAVAVSDKSVGIDIETWLDFERKNYNLDKMKIKFLSADELERFPDAADKRKFLELWTQKESAFKENPCEEGFYSKNIELDEDKLLTKYDFFDEIEYCVSVCSVLKEKCRFVVK